MSLGMHESRLSPGGAPQVPLTALPWKLTEQASPLALPSHAANASGGGGGG